MSFYSNTTGVTGGAGISYHSGVPPALSVVRVAQMLAFCVLFCRLLFDLLSFFLLTIVLFVLLRRCEFESRS